MIKLVIVFLFLTLISGSFAFLGLVPSIIGISKFIFSVCLILFVITLFLTDELFQSYKKDEASD